jgi:hypothetical protein
MAANLARRIHEGFFNNRHYAVAKRLKAGLFAAHLA